MTHADAFLTDILANPADDAPRLIFADWLDEHGQPERGEFVRVQCELARLPGPDAVDDETNPAMRAHDRRYVALRRREREIVEKCGAAWVGELLGIR